MRRSDALAAIALSLVGCERTHAPDAARTGEDGHAPSSPGAGADAPSSVGSAIGPRPARSCSGGNGAGHDCGAGARDEDVGSEDCCETLLVPGGAFHQFDQADYPATVSALFLDRFEVTVGRFRAWISATGGDLRGHAPRAGAGAHPKIPNSGWRDEWNALLPASLDEVDRMLGPEGCQVGSDLTDYGALTWWTPELGARIAKLNHEDADVLEANTQTVLDRKPLNCVPWEVLFAFCVWDGGRLPTNAEWGYAAAGGDEQRLFPWGDMSDGELAVIGEKANLSAAPRFGAGASLVVSALWDDVAGPNVFPSGYVYTWGSRTPNPRANALHIAPVGRRTAGRARWGHDDLAGGLFEWMLDEGPIHPGPCVDCANVSWPPRSKRDPDIPRPFPLADFEDRWFVGGARAVRGGSWDNALGLSNRQTPDEIATYTSYPVRRTYRSLGGRCARDLASNE
jgi:formylglycine-generating enzyme required for sulfatase activity